MNVKAKSLRQFKSDFSKDWGRNSKPVVLDE